MWWVYLLVFFGGAIVRAMLMALMAASRESDPHEVHVYCDEDGNTQLMTLPVEDKIIWHKEPERKSGIWTHEDAGVWTCGVCGKKVGEMGDEYGVPKYNFCPYCEADMTGRRWTDD